MIGLGTHDQAADPREDSEVPLPLWVWVHGRCKVSRSHICLRNNSRPGGNPLQRGICWIGRVPNELFIAIFISNRLHLLHLPHWPLSLAARRKLFFRFSGAGAPILVFSSSRHLAPWTEDTFNEGSQAFAILPNILPPSSSRTGCIRCISRFPLQPEGNRWSCTGGLGMS